MDQCNTYNKDVLCYTTFFLQTNLGRVVDISNASVSALVDKRWSPDMVPHLETNKRIDHRQSKRTNLARSHGKDKEESKEGPGSFVVEELQVVSPQVEQPTHHCKEHQESHGAGVVGRSEHPDVHLSPLSNPLGNCLCRETNPLQVHVVGLLGLSLGREVHEHWCCVQLHRLEHIRALVEVDHGKEELV